MGVKFDAILGKLRQEDVGGSGGGGSGDVVGPSSATDNAVVRFDGTTGKLVQNSSVTIDDSGNINTAGKISSTNRILSWAVHAPATAYAVDTQFPGPRVLNNMTITAVYVTLNTTSYEVAGDLKYADNLTSFSNATLIRALDTTSGVLSATGLSTSVAAGKWLYIDMDSAPDSLVTWMQVTVVYDDD